MAGGTYIPQSVGINNPLAIKDDAVTQVGLAWPGFGYNGCNAPGNFLGNSGDPRAHFNGNGYFDDTAGNFADVATPTLYMNYVGDGTTSRQAWLGIMDRSAVGLNTIGTSGRTQAIQNFQSTRPAIWRGRAARPPSTPAVGINCRGS